MDRPTFFPFTNTPTYLFFRWLTESNAGVDTARLVSEAVAGVEHSPSYQVFEDVSLAAQEILTTQLDDILEDAQAASGLEGEPFNEPDGSPESLCGLLLEQVVRQIETGTVAEALLRLHRKWSPDTTFPEIA